MQKKSMGAIKRAWEGSKEDRKQDAAGMKKMAASGKCKCGKSLDRSGKCPGCGSSPSGCKCK